MRLSWPLRNRVDLERDGEKREPRAKAPEMEGYDDDDMLDNFRSGGSGMGLKRFEGEATPVGLSLCFGVPGLPHARRSEEQCLTCAAETPEEGCAHAHWPHAWLRAWQGRKVRRRRTPLQTPRRRMHLPPDALPSPPTATAHCPLPAPPPLGEILNSCSLASPLLSVPSTLPSLTRTLSLIVGKPE